MKFLRRILKTSEFRLSLVYAVLFSLIAAAALISIYKVAENQIKQQVDTRLKLETNLLLEHYQNQAVEGLVETINFYNNKEGRPFYIYTLIHRHKLDLTRYIPVGKVIKNSNQIFASMPLGEIVDYVPDRKKDDNVRLLLTILPGGYQLLVGAELKETQHLLSKLFQATLIAISIIFTLSILIGGFMARNMIKRISSVTKTADNIIEGDLSQRIPIMENSHNELDRLSLSLNKMLDRNEELMRGMQQVTNNLAHDLRNPLNRIRHRLESSRYRQMNEEEFLRVTDETIHDIDNVIATFNALLNIAQIESGVSRKNWQVFELNALLDNLSEVYEGVAVEQNKEWEYDAANDLRLKGDKQLIAQLLTNLLDNAFKFTPTGGKISLTALYCKQKASDKNKNDQSHIEVIISDSGSGIPEDKHDQVFKRFHRLDDARSTEGNGLGLSLVKAVADLHHAKIHLENSEMGFSLKIIFKCQ